MNRSWFRNPFGGSSSRAEEEDDMLGDEADQVINRSSGSDRSKRKKRRNNKAGASDTSATNTSASFASSSRGDILQEDLPPVPPLPTPAFSTGGQSHIHANSLHSISSIRTAHFVEGRPPGSPEGSTEASPSKTPLHDRMSRLSWASTASGMMKFDDEDREEAERRWAEMEDINEEQTSTSRIRLVNAHDQDHDSFDYLPKLTPSRSSASIKSILKKNMAVAEGLSTPHRKVTFSPSTHPAAPTPPETTVTPEHPRLYALRDHQQDASPLQHSYVADESLLGSDESREVEEALLSRSSVSPVLSANISNNDSTDSIRLQGSASKRGAGFLDRLQTFIPSPDTSFAEPKQAGITTNEASDLLDMSAPSHLQEITVADERSRLKASTGPRPLFLRQSIIVEESSRQMSSTSPPASLPNSPKSPGSPMQDFHSFATAHTMSPTTSLHTPLRESVHSRAGMARKNDSSSKEASRLNHLPRQTSVDGLGRLQESHVNGEIFTAVSVEQSLRDERDGTASSGKLTQTLSSRVLVPIPALTPSSSSSSMVPHNAESPFTSLVSHLLSTQDELLSHRADQKTVLLSLINNLRGELASRDRVVNILEKQKGGVEEKLRQEKAGRSDDRRLEQERLESALQHIEATREKLSSEVQRRDDALREELLHERAKRELAEAQLEQLKRENRQLSEVESMQELLRTKETESRMLQDDNTALRADLEQEYMRARQERESYEQQQREDRAQQVEAQHRADAVEAHVRTLEEQLAAAEMHITRLATSSDTQASSLRSKLANAESEVEELRIRCRDINHTLEHERVEQARQYDYSASVQEELRQEHEHLQVAVARLKQDREQTHRELVSIKNDSAQLLHHREERISQLETEILDRSTERRRLAGEGCADCREAEERTKFLESEIVRLREVVGKMRLESADREVRVARLTKAREQLKEDIDGLNIALEAKQQEVMLLKRTSAEIPGTIRRTNRSRPTSTQDTVLKSSLSSAVPGQTRTRPESRRISFHNMSVIDTPSVGAGTLLSSAAAATLNRKVAMAPLTRQPPARTVKAMDAASLVPTEQEEDKENSGYSSVPRKVVDLPTVPKHDLNSRGRAGNTQPVPMHV